jgi:hypothetical protein
MTTRDRCPVEMGRSGDAGFKREEEKEIPLLWRLGARFLCDGKNKNRAPRRGCPLPRPHFNHQRRPPPEKKVPCCQPRPSNKMPVHSISKDRRIDGSRASRSKPVETHTAHVIKRQVNLFLLQIKKGGNDLETPGIIE